MTDIELLLSGNSRVGYRKKTRGTTGYKASDETRAKLSAIRTGKKRSAETCKAISKALTGRIMPDNVKKKISEAKKGRCPSGAEHKQSRAVITPWGKFGSLSEAGRLIPLTTVTIRSRIKKGVPGYEYI